MFQVIKRDGSKADFTLTKINDAIMKAFTATQMSYNNDIIDLLALRVTADFQKKVENDEIHVEDIQDSVERVLGQAGYEEVAKAYILYRKQREKMRTMKSTILDYKDVVNSYVKVEDWRVKENSTVTYSVGGLILSNSGAVTANYWLSEIYDEEIAEAHRNADIHIHDLSMLTGYCAGWSLKQLIKEGLGGITGKITSAPARHLSVLCNQMVNFLGIMQNEWAGAQAFSSFDTYLAPFVKVDHLSYPEVKKCIEAFIYGVNTPSRWGTQAPFSNITLDWTVPDDLAELPALVGGVEMDFKYKDCKKEMDMVNKAFIETMIEGDSNGRGFQYPIPTYSITKDFDWSDTENNRLLFEMTAKYGTPYFSNYINSDMQPSDVRSMCCRLRLDLRELRKKTGGFFGSGESTGSVGVVTINMPRIAYLSANKDEFYARLNHMMDIAARSLKIKRGVITKLLNEGLYPYTKRYLGTFENHFSTIGLIGMNEVGLNANWLRADMSDPRTQEFTKEVLNHMRERLSDYQEQYGDLYNLEATPAESTTYRLAKHDRKRWPGIKTAGKPGDTPYYTNSSHLPVDYTVDIFDALDIQDELQTLYTSGTVFHAFLGEKLPDWKAAASLVRTIASNYKLPYYTLSPTYSICKEHGYLAGEVKVCPHCGAKTEVYSRITGYYRPVQNWNDGKLQEYANRTEYDIDHSSLKRPTRSVVTLSNFAEDVEVKVEQPQDIKYLFTTKTCPNCKLVKEYLKNVPYVTIDAEENMELARRYGVMQAPTLVVVNGDSHKKYVNASNIKKYVDQLTLVGVE
ncbi:MAG: ribonucleoside triphosphate reductase [Lachnospiraceae bacterium]|jgi:anaerobic ribonucleoside-triphosphate reductase|uniref:Ribonucleoside triphosphate reductase n=1 Tax=Waltera intestinalis TaxID=2606635 RepID=A0A6L5YHE4_9FIRM|nr:ribonucleoside triphosphate reductase [Waltera intestinalis]MBO5162315.1 ribonucleoside triphosphate reductase [Lachnospiraceae bacterium]MDY3657309.1 ribonucleoside triphosphate reductase [Lachnospiraceae bacterium]MST57635.1 ribonucleoside triphosphate reductase [Waltera intestinalis]